MRLFKTITVVAIMGLAAIGCSQGTEESEAGQAVDVGSTAPPEPEPIALPEGLPESVHLYPDMEITAVEVLDADKVQYQITGASMKSVEDVLKYYEKYFPENGWTEDMNMWQEATTIIAASKDGLLVTVESVEGGGGCYVTMTTGKL